MPNEGPRGGDTSGPVQLSWVVNSKCCALLSHSNQGLECGEGLKLGTGVQRSCSAVKSTDSSICVQTISKVLTWLQECPMEPLGRLPDSHPDSSLLLQQSRDMEKRSGE